MKHIIEHMEEILNYHINGFHQYTLSEPVHLTFASQSLCSLLGVSALELCREESDGYATFVHPADRVLYADFLNRLCQGEERVTVQYRLLCAGGGVKYVSDTASSKRLEDGTAVAWSTLTDITQIQDAASNLHFLNETIPCGFLRYTCEKQPKITYINERMMTMLRFGEGEDGEPDDLELYRDNIFLLIPMEERRRFTHFLNQIRLQGGPIGGEMTLLRCDGTQARVYGWVTKSVNEQGQEEFQSVCMDITERHQSKKAVESDRYLKALSQVYDRIFEYDLNRRTVRCLYGQKSDVFRGFENIPVNIDETMEQWIGQAVVEKDREKVRSFFRAFARKDPTPAGEQPLQIRYRALSSSGHIKTYAGIVLKVDPAVSLFCCRSLTDEVAAVPLHEDTAPMERVYDRQEMLVRLTDGMVAFEVENDKVKPLFTSDNVCRFFGYSKEEWLQVAQGNQSIQEFVSHSGIAYEDFLKLFEQGEAEFSYLDLSTQTRQYVKAVCSRKYADRATPCYVMLYNVNDHMVKTTENTQGRIKTYIRTFGYFDVFVEETPIPFRNRKAKELLALLVDRRGGYVTSEEAITFLWEDEEVNAVTLSRYRKVALRLKNTLEEYGVADIVESVDGKRRIVTERVCCDLYDYLSQDEEFSQLFKGSYLTNYSWGETTLGELLSDY